MILKWDKEMGELFNSKSLSQKFFMFGKQECKGSSLLYEHLSVKIAEEDDLLKICSHAREGQPIPNLLFGAVHYLLHPLKEYYPSIVSHPKSYKESFKFFKSFCMKFCHEIQSILKTKFVQTNEVRR